MWSLTLSLFFICCLTSSQTLYSLTDPQKSSLSLPFLSSAETQEFRGIQALPPPFPCSFPSYSFTSVFNPREPSQPHLLYRHTRTHPRARRLRQETPSLPSLALPLHRLCSFSKDGSEDGEAHLGAGEPPPSSSISSDFLFLRPRFIGFRLRRATPNIDRAFSGEASTLGEHLKSSFLLGSFFIVLV